MARGPLPAQSESRLAENLIAAAPAGVDARFLDIVDLPLYVEDLDIEVSNAAISTEGLTTRSSTVAPLSRAAVIVAPSASTTRPSHHADGFEAAMQRWIGWTVDEIVRDMASPASRGVGGMKLRDAMGRAITGVAGRNTRPVPSRPRAAVLA